MPDRPHQGHDRAHAGLPSIVRRSGSSGTTTSTLRRRPSWSPRSRTSTVCVGGHLVRQWGRAMSSESAVGAGSIACGAGLRH